MHKRGAYAHSGAPVWTGWRPSREEGPAHLGFPGTLAGRSERRCFPRGTPASWPPNPNSRRLPWGRATGALTSRDLAVPSGERTGMVRTGQPVHSHERDATVDVQDPRQARKEGPAPAGGARGRAAPGARPPPPPPGVRPGSRHLRHRPQVLGGQEPALGPCVMPRCPRAPVTKRKF